MKKIRILALLMVFAFAALGGAYAMWSDSLLIDETVNTGFLDVKFIDGENYTFNPDPGPNYEDYVGDEGNPYGVYGVEGKEGLDELDPNNPNANKNIAWMDYIISDQYDGDSGAHDNVDDLMTITLNNGYPGYQERIFTTIKNVGTVPAKFEIDTINALSIKDHLLVEIWFDAGPTQAKDNGEDYMIWTNDPGCDNPYRTAKLEGYQIDPGEEIPVAIYTRVRQAAKQKDSYEFSIKLNAIQWNEYDFNLPNDIKGNTKDRVDRVIDGVPQPDEPKFDTVNNLQD
jgi:hypothetical protein